MLCISQARLSLEDLEDGAEDGAGSHPDATGLLTPQQMSDSLWLLNSITAPAADYPETGMPPKVKCPSPREVK